MVQIAPPKRHHTKKIAPLIIFPLFVIFLINPTVLFAVTRGISVVSKQGQPLQLYDSYNALVVGISDYQSWPDLPYAVGDAEEVAKRLKKMGFNVKLVINPNSYELNNAINEMTYRMGRERERAVLFYYAGHGETESMADGTKMGYIIPKDCPLLMKNPMGFASKAVSMRDIESASLRMRAKHVLMLFDSCFSGALFSLVRAAPDDITEKSTLPVRQYITAGREDEQVPDKSMFKRCFLIGLKGAADMTGGGYITGSEMGMYLADNVVNYTRRQQHPQYGKINNPDLDQGDFIFVPLKMLKKRGTRLVLGLRDVLDEPALLVPEWKRKKVLPALKNLYDDIWVYGLPQICEPLGALDLPESVLKKVTYTGYLQRRVPSSPNTTPPPEITKKPYLLVTTGGGGDGDGLIEWVLRAYETDPMLPYPALLVLGPFMQTELQTDFLNRASQLDRVEAITFEQHMESLEDNAVGIVAMGGYNTFCEILSLDKKAIIVPRKVPRLEQFIRASKAESLGLIRMLEDDGKYDPEVMASALRHMPRQSKPSDVVVPGLLEGLVNVRRLIAPWLDRHARKRDVESPTILAKRV